MLLDRDVAYQLSLIQSKVDEIAERAGVPARERLSLEATLGALPLASRRHVGLVLQGLRTYTDNEALASAIHVVTALAAQVWDTRVRGVTVEAEEAAANAPRAPSKPH